MSKNTRLLKVASDINIGKDTIVAYLASKGYEIENKGSTPLTEEMVDIVMEKFKQEFHNVEKQRQKLQKMKILKPATKKDADETLSTKDDVINVVPNISIDVPIDKIEEKSVVEKKPKQIKEIPVIENEPIKIIESDINSDIKTDEIVKEEIKIENNIKEEIENVEILNSDIKNDEVIEENKNDKIDKELTKKTKTDKKIKSKISLTSITDLFDDNLPKVGEIIKVDGAYISPKSKEKKQDKSFLDKSLSRGKSGTRAVKKEQEINKKIEKLSEQDKKLLSISVSKKDLPKTDFKDKKEEQDKKDFVLKRVEKEIVDSSSANEKKRKRKKKKKIIELSEIQIEKKEVKIEEFKIEKKKKKDIELEKVAELQLDRKRRFEELMKEQAPIDLQGLTVLGKIDVDAKKKMHKIPEKTFMSRKYKDGKNKNTSDNKDGKWHKGDSKDRNIGDNKDNKWHKNDNKDGKWHKGDNKDRQAGSYHTNIDRKKDGTGRFENNKTGNSGNYNKSDGYKRNEYKSPYSTLSKTTEKDKKVFTNDSLPKNVRPKNYDDKKKGRKTLRTDPNFDVDKAIRSTLSGMEDTGASSKKAKLKLKKKIEREEKVSRKQELLDRESKILRLTEFVTTSDLAALINIKPNEIILKCMQLGLMVTINQRLDKDTILLIVSDYGLEVEFEEASTLDVIDDDIDTEESLIYRPPIVTIMGHVDHGKTSLLDFVRSTNIVAGEAGGITQHIGAYRVLLDNGKAITFLDTPGHEAFTAMRARGAQVTDIVVIVVAADDSVMPQTIEAISHARAANVPIIVAINKIDKAEANIDKIKQQLSEQGVLVEDWGGKYQCAEISAKKGINIDILLEKILLEAEMLNLKANPNRKAQGVVIESKMTKGWGNVATVVVQKGTLFLQDNFVAGASYGKIRALLDERGNRVKDVLPSQPVVVVGFDGLPNAGDSFVVVSSETEAREVATKRSQLRREQEMRKVRLTTLDDISAQISIGGVKDLNLIIKGDVAGSVEALSDSLLKLSTEEVRVNIILKQAGIITESDVMLAAASNAIIIGFNISSTPQAARLADQEQVEIRRYNIIYDCINEIHLALEGMLKPDIKEEIAATIEVRQIFKISKIGQIAGCYVSNGKVTRNDKIRVVREGFPIFSGSIISLKRNKDDVREVDGGYECGIQVGNFNNFELGDIIEVLKYIEIKRTLEIKK